MIHVNSYFFLKGAHVGLKQASFRRAHRKGKSVVLSTLVYPQPDGIKLLLGSAHRLSMWHFDRWIGTPFHQHQHVAAKTVPGNDHRAVAGACHQVIIAFNVETAGNISLTSGEV